MPTGLYAVVVAPIAANPRGATLLRSANVITEADPRWMQGLTWRPNLCGDRNIVEAVDICTAFSGFDTLTEEAAPTYVPPHVAVALPCSGFSGMTVLEETRDRAVALLERCQTLGIADELWTGDAAVAASWPNEYLSDPAAITGAADLGGGSALTVLDSLAALEEELGACSCAGNGMIHATIQTVTYWHHLRLVDRMPDGRILTVHGTTVVADPGYDGSSPAGVVDADGSSAWAYISGMVDIRLGPVEVSTGDGMDLRGLSRTNDDFVVYAHRPFAATFDPCCRAGVLVNHASLT